MGKANKSICSLTRLKMVQLLGLMCQREACVLPFELDLGVGNENNEYMNFINAYNHVHLLHEQIKPFVQVLHYMFLSL
jgi:hypothetical protein